MDALDLAGLPLGTKQPLELEVAPLASGHKLALPVNVIMGSVTGLSLALIAGIHGDEGEGILALMELWDELRCADIAGRILMVPVANPPAFAAHRRTSPLDDLDLNRIFPGRPDGGPSERIAYRLFEAVLKQADFVFSMHSWYRAGIVLPYVEYDHQATTARASLAAANASGFEIVRISEWPPGLMTRVVNEAGIPGIEAEIGGTGISTAMNRARYKTHVLALMAHLGMLPGHGKQLILRAAKIVDYIDIVAPAGGILHVDVELGGSVEPQLRLGRITDLHGALCAEIIARHRGIIGGLRAAVSVNPGDVVFRIFRDIPPPPSSG